VAILSLLVLHKQEMALRNALIVLMLIGVGSGCASTDSPVFSAAANTPRRAEIEQSPAFADDANIFNAAKQAELLEAARRSGAIAIIIAPRTDALLREVAAGAPVVVQLKPAADATSAVVMGYDLDAKTVSLLSGKAPRTSQPLASFERDWASAAHWGFTATAPSKLPVTATEKETQQALIAFEKVAKPADAAVAYSTASQRWPSNAVLRMGLGNSLHAAGDKARASQVYEQLAREKKSGAAWVNLAMTYAEQGKKREANEAAQQALASGEPWAAKARELLKKLNGGVSGW
jgi:tetratricopeptide (TPR) repeat protein